MSMIVPRGSRVLSEEQAVDDAQQFAKHALSWKEYVARLETALGLLVEPSRRCETVIGMAAVRP